MERIYSVEIIVVCFNLTVVVPKLRQIFLGLQDDYYWLDDTNQNVLQQEVDDVDGNHQLVVSKMTRAVATGNYKRDDEIDRNCN